MKLENKNHPLHKMYIVCPECSTRFTIPQQQIGPAGRKVKCSRCSSVWHYQPGAQVRITPVIATPASSTYAATELSSGVNLPVPLPLKPAHTRAPAPQILVGLVILLSLLLFSGRPGWKFLIKFRELAIENIRIENQPETGRIIVSYTIANSSDHKVAMPLARVRLMDGNNIAVKDHVEDKGGMILAPSQYISMTTEFEAPLTPAKYVDITLGNKLDFLLR